MKSEIRSAVRIACNYRGDSQQHYQQCLIDIFDEPEEDWPWYIEYFKSEGKQ